ncbi:MAG: hypothetical protein AB1796_01670 [Bacillota bacterium]
MEADLNIFIAFTGGMLSFFSPCVLPLVPCLPTWGHAVHGHSNHATVTAERRGRSNKPGTAGAPFPTVLR